MNIQSHAHISPFESGHETNEYVSGPEVAPCSHLLNLQLTAGTYTGEVNKVKL